ncbi:MAG: hypothetical protein OEM03_03435 [Chromatiales bacterium]|nr:hypothetical protein [Chromatiales bacterium]
MPGGFKVRNVFFALLGAAGLVFKPLYAGPFQEFVLSYGGNFSVSFALYFAAINASVNTAYPRFLAALLVLVAVQAFELLDGFGVMANVYDPLDLLANFAGVGFAVLVDLASLAALPGSPRQSQ